MAKKKKRPIPLKLRVAGNLLLLAAMAALAVGMFRLPHWILEGQLRAAQAAAGLTGQGELLWEGRTCNGMSWRETAVQMEGGTLFVSWQDRYEGGYSFPVYAAKLPGGPVVTPINPVISWTAVRAEQGEDFFYQLMAVDLPEEAAGGRLAVTPGPGAAVRTVEGTRDRGIIPFYPTGD